MTRILSLSPKQVNMLIDEHHFHLPANGRINVAGLNTGNLDRAACAIDAVKRASVQ